MSVSGVAGVASAVPAPTREQMAAIVTARPAALQLQAVAAASLDRGTSGQGTPAINPGAGVDLYL